MHFFCLDLSIVFQGFDNSYQYTLHYFISIISPSTIYGASSNTYCSSLDLNLSQGCSFAVPMAGCDNTIVKFKYTVIW